MYKVAVGLNRLWNEECTGRGCPRYAGITRVEAGAAIETAGEIHTGAPLVNRIGSYVAANLSGSAEDVNTLVSTIASGELSGGGSASMRGLALQGLSHDHRLIRLGAAVFALLAALLTWIMVRPKRHCTKQRL
jgi:hypothetical protein